jgi:hypothetical protein
VLSEGKSHSIQKIIIFVEKQSQMIKVANPIYDVVFKYLMEDTRVAKLLISALLELEVLEIELKPSEYSADIKEAGLTVYRIDFKARIKDKYGKEQLVLIELQKAKLPTDIMRFRRYLGMQYAHKDNVAAEPQGTYALPIITIYFLGYPLDKFKDIPIIRVARQYINHGTKEVLEGKEYFIESLTHDSIIVQIQAIQKKKHRNKLEQVLSVFDQSKVHEVIINEEDYPEEYRDIMRRLIKALAKPELREVMNIEDDIIEELASKERLLKNLLKKSEEAIKKAEKERKEKEKAKRKEQEAKQLAEKERKEKEQAKQKEQEARKKEREAKLKLAIMMKELGKSIEDIIKETGLNKEDIEKL